MSNKAEKLLFDGMPLPEYLEQMETNALFNGMEVVNPKPLVLDLGDRPMTLKEQVERLMRVELSRKAMDQGFESFEEFHDFGEEEDQDDFVSQYEVKEMVEEEPLKETPAKVEVRSNDRTGTVPEHQEVDDKDKVDGE